jgi:hypothetical protein
MVSAVNRVDFVSDKMSYIVLRGHWCDIIVLNVHAWCMHIQNDVTKLLIQKTVFMMRGAYRVLVKKPEGKRPHGRPRA